MKQKNQLVFFLLMCLSLTGCFTTHNPNHPETFPETLEQPPESNHDVSTELVFGVDALDYLIFSSEEIELGSKLVLQAIEAKGYLAESVAMHREDAYAVLKSYWETHNDIDPYQTLVLFSNESLDNNFVEQEQWCYILTRASSNDEWQIIDQWLIETKFVFK